MFTETTHVFGRGRAPTAPYRTERLTLRAWTEADATDHFAVYSQWEVMRWLGADPQPITDPAQSVPRILRWATLRNDPFGIWAVVPDAVGRPVGSALLGPLQDGAGSPLPEFEVGWHLHPDHWGHGYATESARLLLDLAWQSGLDEVWAVVRPGNDRSTAVAERLGMSPQGLTDRWYGVPLQSYRVLASMR